MRKPKAPSLGEIRLKNEPRPPERFILSLDGGGMRGMVSATVLEEFDKLLRGKGAQGPLARLFDMVAGTSTGGLLAMALTCPSSLGRKDGEERGLPATSELPRLYLDHGGTIFSEPVPAILNAVTDKYSPRRFEELLRTWFGDAPFSSCVVPTLAMAYNVTAGVPYPIQSTVNRELLAWEAGRCTSAAPTYFPPHRLGSQLIVDGGVIANNPAFYAYHYAKSLWPDCPRFHILSLGTGTGTYRFKSAATYGFLSWTSVHKVYATAQHQTTDTVMEDLPDADYVRIHRELREKIDMDDTRRSTALKLREEGHILFNHSLPALDAYAEALVQARTAPPPAPEAQEPPRRPGVFRRILDLLTGGGL